ncbi:TVP38/TMEM64 family protein [Salinibaculum rarum]|uniref:TVP38/TMEM64 family protein n=1 Tax=Salinibaculum rarum TaxID=3058903 RepID=UPI0026604E28|nr:VTT domain-containing protein [Salinibaculum sp. KK48]
MERATRRQVLGMACLGAVALVAAVLFSPAGVVTKLEHLATHPGQFALALVAVYLVRPFLLWPVSSIALVLGYVYGPVVAVPIAIAGAAVSGLPPFAVARYVRSDVGLFGSVADTGRRLTDAVGETRGVLVARLSPIPGDPISYASGLSNVSLGAFLTGTLFGEVPWALVTVLAGDSMRTLSVTGFTLSPAAVLAIAGLGVIVLSGPLYSRLREPQPE